MNEASNKWIKVLEATDIFSSLSRDKIIQLAEEMEIIKLNPGEILFKQGELPDAMYVVASGTLSVILTLTTGATQNIGVVHRGQTVGEAGLLSSQKRQMTVKSLQPTELIKLSKDAFERIIKKDNDSLLLIINLILSRSKKTIHMLHHNFEYKGYLFISANMDFDFSKIMDVLMTLKQKTDIIFLKASDFISSQLDPIQISAHLDKLEKQHEFIFYFIDTWNPNIIDILAEHSDCLTIFASGENAPSLHEIPKMLLSDKYQFSAAYLSLFYGHNKTPKHTTEWLDIYPFNNHYHIWMDKPNDYRRLLRCLVESPLGLVLGGGGHRGWVEVGVLKALYEANIEIDYVGGTSIGALIGALYLQHDTYEGLINAYLEMVKKLKNPLSITNYIYPIISLTGGKNSIFLFENGFQDQLIENLPKPFFCISACLEQSSQAVHFRGLLRKWVRASACIPGILPPVVDEGRLYIDGGVINYLPTDVMKDYMQNRGHIIAVDLSVSMKEKKYDFPSVIGFWESVFIKLGFVKKYTFPDFYSFLERSIFLGANERTIHNAKLADILIQPNLSGFSSLFEIKNYEQLIQIGYEEMKSKISIIQSSRKRFS